MLGNTADNYASANGLMAGPCMRCSLAGQTCVRYEVRGAAGCRDVDLLARLNRGASWQGGSFSAAKNNNVCHREAARGKSIFEADQTQLKMPCFFLLFPPSLCLGLGTGKDW